jgi:hypothetical protein
MLGEPPDPRMDPKPVLGVLAWDGDAWDCLSGGLMGRTVLLGVLGWDGDARAGLSGLMRRTVLLWEEKALPGEGGAAAAAAAAAGEPMRACGLDEDPGDCILPWEGDPMAKEVPTPALSCLSGGVGMGGAEAQGRSFLTEGGGGAGAGDSVSAGLLFLPPPPLPDPEGLPVEEEELEALLGVPDMRSQMLMGPAHREEGVDSRIRVFSTAKGRN